MTIAEVQRIKEVTFNWELLLKALLYIKQLQ